MSLINKMLQDLEERRSEAVGTEPMFAHVRVAPQRTRIHAAWWVVLGLTLALTAAVSWIWGRQSAPDSVKAAHTQLALKLDPDLGGPVTNLPQAKDEGTKTAEPALSDSRLGELVGKPEVPVPVDSTAGRQSPPQIAVPEQLAPQRPVAAPPNASAESIPAAKLADSSKEPAVSAIPKVRDASLRAAIAPSEKPKAATGTSPLPQKGNDDESVSNVVKQVKELTPQQRADNEYRRATLLLQQNRSQDAVSALEQALQLDPFHSVARQTLAGVLVDGRRTEEAIRKLQEGLAVDRTQPALAMMLARLQVEKGELRPAIETLQKTLPQAAERSDYQAFIAALLQRDGRHKEAIEHYFVALRKSPQNGLWWMGIGISLQAENRVAEARDAFNRAKASSTLSPELLAYVEQKLGQLR